MAEPNKPYKNIYQNLIDAGCDENTIGKCMLFLKESKATDMLPVLAKHRKNLLASVHTGQKQIDCLDYLIYFLKKQEVEETK